MRKDKCYCGSNKSFATCCQAFINSDDLQPAYPPTPEKLMRSRFSAYVIGNGQYIYDTYASSSQTLQSVDEINDWSEACTWIALEIHSKSYNELIENDISDQFVEFSAFYVSEDTLFELRENSRFVLEPENQTKIQWRYIDGDIIKHSELARIKRKDTCPCNNYLTAWSLKKGKKFKQCCGK